MKKKVISFLILAVLVLNILRVDAFSATANVYRRVESSDKKIALTFDDGPHPRITREILGILDEYGIKATFFVIGQNIVNYPETMELLVKSGCEVGNHTYSHENFRNMSQDEIRAEFDKCRQTLKENFSVEPTLIRPPQGFCSEALSTVSTEMNCDIILWSIDTRDWDHTAPEDIARNILANARGGDIILMHDYVSGKSGTCEALRIIIPELLGRGFEFVTVGELIGNRG